MLEIAIDADRCPLMIGISKAIDSARAPPARNQNANARRGLEPESCFSNYFSRRGLGALLETRDGISKLFATT